jgi:uncharacterized membrane protein
MQDPTIGWIVRMLTTGKSEEEIEEYLSTHGIEEHIAEEFIDIAKGQINMMRQRTVVPNYPMFSPPKSQDAISSIARQNVKGYEGEMQKNYQENPDSLAVFSWCPIGGLLVALYAFFTKKEDWFVQFHAKQALIFWIIVIILAVIPGVGIVLSIASFFYSIYMMIKAKSGQMQEVPFVIGISRKF